jgi:hypothetical protein
MWALFAQFWCNRPKAEVRMKFARRDAKMREANRLRTLWPISSMEATEIRPLPGGNIYSSEVRLKMHISERFLVSFSHKNVEM